MFKVTRSRSKVAFGSKHDIAQLDHIRHINVSYEPLPVYGDRDLAQTKSQLLLCQTTGVKTIPTQTYMTVGLKVTLYQLGQVII